MLNVKRHGNLYHLESSGSAASIPPYPVKVESRAWGMNPSLVWHFMGDRLFAHLPF